MGVSTGNLGKWLEQISSVGAIYRNQGSEEVIVRTPQGSIRGRVHDSIATFKNIPYAKPPVGELRFAPPIKAEPWEGVRNGWKFGSMAHQIGQERCSEDCLSLHIWTPALGTTEPLPVYVYIHGGAFAIGSGMQDVYEATEMAKQGVVVVTLNYRLNALGFLPSRTTYEQYGTTGNWGILDMLCALEWVRDSISVFGGDPKRVTIGGESAGSFAVSTLISSPLAKGLFQQAIMESGALPNSKAAAPMSAGSLEEAFIMGERFAALMGGSDTPEGLAYLRRLPAQDIANGAQYVIGDYSNPQATAFWVIPDGYVIPKQPVQEIKQGNIQQVNLLTGFNTDEGSIFTPLHSTEATYRTAVYHMFGNKAAQVFQRYPLDAQHTAFQRTSEICGLAMLVAGSYIYADALAQAGRQVYAYRFDFQDPLLQGTPFGVAHGSESKYVFNTFMDETQQGENCQRVAKLMLTAWSNFIKQGDPNKGTPLEKGLVWQPYKKEQRVELRICEESAMEPLYKAEDIDFINRIRHSA